MFALQEEIVSRAVRCAVDASWRQWRALAAAGLPVGERTIASVIDPEALVLVSLTVRQHERRLDDQLLWWAAAGTSLMSVQRMRTLLADFPERLRQEVSWFASMAVAAGDQRWKVLVDGTSHSSGRADKGPRELQLLEPSTLMLRLRAGFGVGAKADLLTFLLGAAGTLNEPRVWATAEVIAKAISYSVASTRRAAGEMVLARLVEASADRPTHYFLDTSSWAQLLRLRDPFKAQSDRGEASTRTFDVPPWRFWAQMFAFLAACSELGNDGLATAPRVVQASHLRDLVERFRRPLAWNGIEWFDPRLFPGERYLEAFERVMGSVVSLVETRA